MNYELAKKLNDAGFEFNPRKDWGKSDFYLDPATGDERNERQKIWIPTLSELVEACGNEYASKTIPARRYEFGLMYSRGSWFAGYFDDMFGCSELEDGHGDNPITAVANLWLAIRGK